MDLDPKLLAQNGITRLVNSKLTLGNLKTLAIVIASLEASIRERIHPQFSLFENAKVIDHREVVQVNGQAITFRDNKDIVYSFDPSESKWRPLNKYTAEGVTFVPDQYVVLGI